MIPRGGGPGVSVGHTCIYLPSEDDGKGKVLIIGGANPNGSFSESHVINLGKDKMSHQHNIMSGTCLFIVFHIISMFYFISMSQLVILPITSICSDIFFDWQFHVCPSHPIRQSRVGHSWMGGSGGAVWTLQLCPWELSTEPVGVRRGTAEWQPQLCPEPTTHRYGDLCSVILIHGCS